MESSQDGILPADENNVAAAEQATSIAAGESNDDHLNAKRPLDDDHDNSSPQSHDTKRRRTDSVNPGDEQSTTSVAQTGDTLEPQALSATHMLDAINSGNQIEKEKGDKEPSASKSPVDIAQKQDATQASAAEGGPSSVVEMLSNIMEHTGQLEEQNALNKQLHELGNQTNLIFPKVNSNLQAQSLPILDNLATQILSLLARSTYQEITSIVSEPHSEDAQAYSTMRSLFEHTKRVYSTGGPFLSAAGLGLTNNDQIETIRKANVASFVSSIFGSQEVGFSALDDHFLDVFVPEGGRLLKMQGAIYLELKTQAFISAIKAKENTNSEILYRLFPNDLGLKLLARRPGSRHLAPTETDFVKRAWSRRDILLSEAENPDLASKLLERYPWEHFLRDLSTYISKNFEGLGQQQGQFKKPIKSRSATSAKEDEGSDQPPAPLETQFPVAPPNPPEPPAERPGRDDLVARAARAAQIALQGQGLRQKRSPSQDQQLPQQNSPQQNQQGQQRPQPPHGQSQPQQQQQFGQTPGQAPSMSSPSQGSNQPQQFAYQYSNTASNAPPPQTSQPPQITFRHQQPLQFQQYNPNAAMTSRANAAAANYGYMPGVPHYSQSQPTQILYERARLATTAKSSPSSRRAGLPSQRRPWTTEEENALMAGLDRVKGPHWSQILAMFGPGGTISEALKDRNQVQLKDKARNLKLFFLKSGIEVPYYLKFVTGELKTRAPGQAAKHEAREQERRQGEEDKAHVEGIEGMMALAGAHPGANVDDQNNAQGSPGIGANPGAPAPSQVPPPPPQQQHQQQHQTQPEQTTEQVLIQRLTQEDNKQPTQLAQPAQPTQSAQQQGNVDPALQ